MPPVATCRWVAVENPQRAHSFSVRRERPDDPPELPRFPSAAGAWGQVIRVLTERLGHVRTARDLAQRRHREAAARRVQEHRRARGAAHA
jgi:hypothetical protein